MNRLLALPIRLEDFDGDIQNLQRTKQGTQKLGNFGSFSCYFNENQPSGSVHFTAFEFPFNYTATVEKASITNQQLEFGNRVFNFEGKLGESLNIERGVITLDGKVQIHIRISGSKIDDLQIIQGGYTVRAFEPLSDEIIIYPSISSVGPVLQINPRNSKLTFGKYTPEQLETGEFIEVNLIQGLFATRNYDKGNLVGLQKEIDFRNKIPFVKIFKTNRNSQYDFQFNFADGRIITTNQESSPATLKVNGANSYITGGLTGIDLEGPVKLILDGKTAVNCEMKQSKLLIDNIPYLFGAIEAFAVGDEPNALNGHLEHDFGNGLVYNGFFRNDFVYCHKDAFPASVTDSQKDRHFDVMNFLQRVDWFEGGIDHFKPTGVCRVKYHEGSTFTGCLNDCFLKTGVGQLLEKSGRLFIGSFRNDFYHGFGKLIINEKVILGIFEKGILKFEMDADHLNVSDLKDLENLAEFLEGEMTLEEVRNLLESRLKSRVGETAAIGDDLGVYIKNVDRKKLIEQGKLLQAKSEHLVIVTIFHFKNGFAYHGKLVGNFILDKDEGDVITPDGVRIPCRYKAMQDLNMGAFKSIDGRLFFMFNYDKKILGEVDLNETR